MEKKKKYRLKFMFQEIDLFAGKFVIGRSPSCNLTLEDPLVSRQHVRIKIEAQSATIEDLGSRNGTLVNNEPLFDEAPLQHKDRIRVGSHEMLFLEESKFPSRPMRPTGAMMNCPSCRIPIAAGTKQCPHCGADMDPKSKCKKCGAPVDDSHRSCAACGARLSNRDNTIPVEIGGASSGWTSNLINEVFQKAIKAGRYEHAANLLDGKVEDFELKSKTGAVDIATLLEISSYSALVARKLQQPDRLRWVVKAWAKAAAPMPSKTLDELLTSASGLCSLSEDLLSYAQTLKLANSTDGARNLVAHLEKIAREQA